MLKEKEEGEERELETRDKEAEERRIELKRIRKEEKTNERNFLVCLNCRAQLSTDYLFCNRCQSFQVNMKETCFVTVASSLSTRSFYESWKMKISWQKRN
jgi:hypothetical protein